MSIRQSEGKVSPKRWFRFGVFEFDGLVDRGASATRAHHVRLRVAEAQRHSFFLALRTRGASGSDGA